MNARRVSAAILLYGILGIGCSGEGYSRERKVSTVGPNRYDFGRVKNPGRSLKHEFTVINRTPKTVRIAEVKRTCTCVDLEVEKRVLEPGGTAKVTVGLDALLFWGEKDSYAVLVFDDPEIETLYLGVRAFLEKEYRVLVRPARWALAVDQEPGATARRTFHAREIISAAIAQGDVTRVRSLDDRVRVVAVGPWKHAGEVIDGHAREAEVVLECMIEPEMESTFWFNLEFTHEFSGGSSQGGSLTAETKLSLARL